MVSFALYFMEYEFAAPLGIEFVDINDDPLVDTLDEVVDSDLVNTAVNNIVLRADNQTVDGASYDPTQEYNRFVAWSVFEVLPVATATYPLYILVALGMPVSFVIIISVGMAFILVRAIIGLVRGW